MRWLRLAADPGSDDMVLAIGDAAGSTGRLTTVPYDGATRTWGAVSPFHTLGTFGDPLRNRPFDLVWDPIVNARGVLLVYADAAGLWSARSVDGGVGFGSSSPVDGDEPAYWVQLERQLDGIVQLAAHDASDDLRGWIWNGYYWMPTTTTTVSSDLEAGASHAVEAFALASLIGAGRPVPRTSDFDGDGRSDILWQNQATGALSVWFMENAVLTGASYLRPESFADPKWQIRALGDFNRDGSLDVLWQHRATRELFAWFLDRAVAVGGSYLSPRAAPEADWEVQGAADFDGDGGVDLLWSDPDTRELHVWLMDGLDLRKTVKLGLTSFADTNWQIRALADLNGDGKPDVIWHNQATGGLYAWLMNGLALASSGYLDPLHLGQRSVAPGPGVGLRRRPQARLPLATPEDGRALPLVHGRHDGEVGRLPEPEPLRRHEVDGRPAVAATGRRGSRSRGRRCPAPRTPAGSAPRARTGRSGRGRGSRSARRGRASSSSRTRPWCSSS